MQMLLSIVHIYFDWSCNDTLFFHDTIYFHDTVYIDLNGIENVQTTEARSYQRDGQIGVEIEDGSEPLDVRVYDLWPAPMFQPTILLSTRS